MTYATLWDLMTDDACDPIDVDRDPVLPLPDGWIAIRRDVLGQDGPRLADPLAEERDSGR